MTTNSDDPSLIRLLNATSIIPYRFTLHRPLAFPRKTVLQYVFHCRRVSADKNDRYICSLKICKLPIDSTGLQHIQEEFKIEHKLYLIRHNENEWLWYCKKLDNLVVLDPPIAIACIYSTVRKRWRLCGNYRQINSLFTLNQFGEGLGLMARMFADDHSVHIYADKPVLEISSTCYVGSVAYTSVFEDGGGGAKDSDEEQDDKKDLENPPKTNLLQQWHVAVLGT